jgi:hypothetical protein
MIDDGDYEFWKSRFGDVVSTELGGPPVPEPSAFCLVMIGAIAWWQSGRFSRNWR